MSDLNATVVEKPNGFHVEGYEKIEYDFTFLDGVCELQNPQLANLYERWGRCLAIMDKNIFDLYGHQMERYFKHYNLELKIHQTMIGEKAKTLETFTQIVDSMTEFGIIRKEPVLVVVCVSFSCQWKNILTQTCWKGGGLGHRRRGVSISPVAFVPGLDDSLISIASSQVCLRSLSSQHQLHPYPNDCDWSHRRKC